MKRKMFILGLFISLVGLFAFVYSSIDKVYPSADKFDKEVLACPCGDVEIDNQLKFSLSCCPPPPGGLPPRLQVYGCSGTVYDWIDLCVIKHGTFPLPCIGGDCGDGCPIGVNMIGYQMVFPAPGGSAVYTTPGNSCACPGQTIKITIDNSAIPTKIILQCI